MLRIVITSFVFLLLAFSAYAQDTISYQPSEHNQRGSIALEIAYSSVGFAAGFATGNGFQLIEDDLAGREPHGPPWIVTTPFISSLFCHLEGSHYFSRPGGSYWGGFLGAFLGEMIGVIPYLTFAFTPNSISPFMYRTLYYCSFWVPTTLMTVWFYNIFGYSETMEGEPASKIQVLPVITKDFQGIGLYSRF